MVEATGWVSAKAILWMKGRSFFKGLISWGGVLSLVILIQNFQSEDLIQGFIPHFPEPILNAQRQTESLEGQPIQVLYVWGSWCGICKLMQGTVSALAEEYPLVTVAMNSGDAKQVLDYERAHNFNLPTVLDEEGRYASSLGVQAVPALFLLSSDGKVIWRTVGLTTYWGVKLRLLFLAEPFGSVH